MGSGGSVAGMDRALRGAACAVHGLEERLCATAERARMRGERGGDAVRTHVRASSASDIIAASSPQAKGRVERAHGTHQDRLVKKLRLAGIADYEAASAISTSTTLPSITGVTRGRQLRSRLSPAKPDGAATR